MFQYDDGETIHTLDLSSINVDEIDSIADINIGDKSAAVYMKNLDILVVPVLSQTESV